MKLARMVRTTRQMMLAVGLTALLMWPVGLRRFYGSMAVAHDRQYEQKCIEMQDSPEWREWERLNREWVGLGSAADGSAAEGRIIVAARQVSGELERRYFHSIQYHRVMAHKYHDAASRPWLPLGSDPPEPKGIPSGASGG
jgi:hypothetical protein